MRISVDPDPSSLNALTRAFVFGIKHLLLAYERFQYSILEINKRRAEYDAIDATCKEIGLYYKNLGSLSQEERDSFIENSYDHRLSNGLQIKDYYEKVVWNSDAKRLMTYPNFTSPHFKEGDPTAWVRHRDELTFRIHEAHQAFLATCVSINDSPI